MSAAAGVLAAPGGRRPAGLAQHPGADLADEAEVLGDGDEAVGRHGAEGGRLPAQQRLEAEHPLVGQVDDGLVDQPELVGDERAGQLLLEPALLDGGRAHVRVEDHRAAPAGDLRRVHGDVGVPDERLPGRVLPRHGDADTAADRDLLAGQLHRVGEDVEHAVGRCAGLVRAVAGAPDQDGELVPAEPGDGVPGADRRPQPVGHLPQQRVAGLVAEGVVDRLEAVEVDEDDRRRDVPPVTAAQGLADAVGEEGPVGQAGEGVVEGLVGQRLLGALAVGDVRDVDDDTADVRVGAQVGQPHADPPLLAVVAPARELGVHDGAAGRHRLVEHTPGLDPVDAGQPHEVAGGELRLGPRAEDAAQ